MDISPMLTKEDFNTIDMQLELFKHGQHITFAETEKECNQLIRKDPDFTNYPDLSKQSDYCIKPVVPYVTYIHLEQLEGGQRKQSGSKIKDVSSVFNSIGSLATMGYNKCRITITFSDGHTYIVRCDASPRDYSLEYQLQLIFGNRYWLGDVKDNGCIY